MSLFKGAISEILISGGNTGDGQSDDSHSESEGNDETPKKGAPVTPRPSKERRRAASICQKWWRTKMPKGADLPECKR